MNKSLSKPTDRPQAREPALKAGQFSIAAILGAMVIVGALLAVFRLSLLGGFAFSAIVLPALARTFWAETLRKQAGASGAQGDVVGTYFVSLAIMVVIAALSLAVSAVIYGGVFIWFMWDSPGNVPIASAAVVATVLYSGLFWLSRPRPSHYTS